MAALALYVFGRRQALVATSMQVADAR
jgi:hypothetical protein